MKSQPVTLEGITYPSVKAAAEAYGITPMLIYSRLRSSWTVEQAFGLEVHPRSSSNAQRITVNGIAYPSMQAACAACGITCPAVSYRLKTGWTVEQAFGVAPRPPRKPCRRRVSSRKRGKPITVDGITYRSIRAAAEAHGMSLTLIYTRLRMSWTVEQAFELEARPHCGASLKRVTVNGVNYRSLNAACEACHISRSDLIFYMNRGASLEQAFEIVSHKQYRKKTGREPVA